MAFELLHLQVDNCDTESRGLMTRGTVVLLGNLTARPVALSETAAEFGWAVETVRDEDELERAWQRNPVVAVLFDPQAVAENYLEASVRSAMNAVLRAAQGAFLITCQKFSDPIPWPELADLGAFHSLSLPVDPSELRRSLGFVWAARRRHTASVIQLSQAVGEVKKEAAATEDAAVVTSNPSDQETVVRERGPARQHARAAENVA